MTPKHTSPFGARFVAWLHDGRIDAALVGSTMAPEAIAAEYGWQVLGWVGNYFQIPTVGVAVDPTHIHPDDPAVQAVVRAHQRALQVIHNEPHTRVRYMHPFLGRHTKLEHAHLLSHSAHAQEIENGQLPNTTELMISSSG